MIPLRITGLFLLASSSALAGTLSTTPRATAAVEQAQGLMRECKYDDAETVIAKALDSASAEDRGLLLLMSGNVAENRGDIARALAQYHAATQGEPVPADALRLLGLAQVRNRQFAAGYASLKAFVLNLPHDALPRDLDLAALSIAAAESGRLDEARTLLDKVKAEYTTYDSLIGDLDAAYATARAAPAPPAPGKFWAIAYGSEAALTSMSLDYTAVPLRRVPPRYPSAAIKWHKQGHVLMRVSIDDKGTVTQVEAIESQPPKVFDDAAITAVRQWTYKPAVRHCVPAASTGFQRIDFRMGRRP